MIGYFNETAVSEKISEALKDEMLEAMLDLVNECDLSESKKKKLFKYYEKMI